MNSLPPSALNDILRLVTWKDDVALIDLTHVCRLFRTTIIGDPSFWTTLNVLLTETHPRIQDSMMKMLLWMFRSDDRPLHLNVEVSSGFGEEPESLLVDILRFHASSWGSIFISAQSPSSAQRATDELLANISAEQLTSVTLMLNTEGDFSLKWPSGTNAPALRHLASCGVQIEGNFAYAELHSFEVHVRANRTLSLGWLTASSLQSLYIDWKGHSEVQPDIASQALCLPVLTTLTIEDRTGNMASAAFVLSIIVCPVLRELHIRGDVETPKLTLSTAIAICVENIDAAELRILTFDGVNFNTTLYEWVFKHHSHSLREITFQNSSIDDDALAMLCTPQLCPQLGVLRLQACSRIAFDAMFVSMLGQFRQSSEGLEVGKKFRLLLDKKMFDEGWWKLQETSSGKERISSYEVCCSRLTADQEFLANERTRKIESETLMCIS